MTTAEELLAFLAAHGIAQRTAWHPAVFTVAEAKAWRGDLPGAHTKNLFLIDRKGSLWLVVAEEDRAVDLKALRRALSAPALSFAKPEALRETLGVEPGSVTPFGVINDRAGRVTVVLDRTLMAAPLLNFHPLVNTATTAIAPDGLLTFLAATGHPPRLVTLDEGTDLPEGGDQAARRS